MEWTSSTLLRWVWYVGAVIAVLLVVQITLFLLVGPVFGHMSGGGSTGKVHVVHTGG